VQDLAGLLRMAADPLPPVGQQLLQVAGQRGRVQRRDPNGTLAGTRGLNATTEDRCIKVFQACARRDDREVACRLPFR
jgi:hypothetical protein